MLTGFTYFVNHVKRIWFSFPIQLLLTNLKKNQVIVLFWILLFGFVVADWGKLFGIPYLFLDPEYHGQVNGRSLFIMGLAFGVFNSSFQITCYILDFERFRFLATIRNAIYKFTINNSILPGLFILVFGWQFWHFQVARGLENRFEAAMEFGAFIGGFLWVTFLTILYFRISSSGPLRNLSRAINQRLKNFSLYRLSMWKRIRSVKAHNLKVGYYFSGGFKIKRARLTDNPIRLGANEEVFSQNHLAAVLLELLTIFMLWIMGLFGGRGMFHIPAGASIFLFFGFVLMFIGAISYWLRGWSISIFLGLLICINLLFSLGWLNRVYQAFGMDYSKKVLYSPEKIKSMALDSLYVKDSLETIGVLNRWKAKTFEQKPKMVFMCTSGGGIRSATWTMRTLQYADSTLDSKLMNQMVLMTGASGGLLGAAYFRELYLQNLREPGVDYFERKYINHISKDILNPVVFSMITNDILIRLKKFNDGKYTYNADRGLVFEQILNQNLNNALNKQLYHYKNPERDAVIPMLMMAPVIINDGRRLYISPLHISYMTWDKGNRNSTPEFKLVRGVEFGRFFDSCDAMRLNFTSAIRMNATFPYITPNVALPTFPTIEVMDGGLSDNFGVTDALKFIHTFQGWIEQETSGVVLMCIRDTPKERPFKKQTADSWFSRIINPVGSVYANWARNQDNNNDQQEEYLSRSLHVPLDVVTFQYLADADLRETESKEHKPEERASLSWHLTTFEKQSIEYSIMNTPNQLALKKLQELLRAGSVKNQ